MKKGKSESWTPESRALRRESEAVLSLVREFVFTDLPDLTPHCRSNTFLFQQTLPFSPAGRTSPQLLPISSTSIGTPASLEESFTPTNPCVPATNGNVLGPNRGRQSCRRQLGFLSLFFFFGLLMSQRGREKTSVFPTLKEHSLRALKPSSRPKNKPPAPLSTHSQLGSTISGQQGWP